MNPPPTPYSHAQARRDIEMQADNRLPASRQPALEDHLATCPDCRAYRQEFLTLEKSLSDLFHTLPTVEYTPAENQAFAAEVKNTAAALRPRWQLPQWLNSLAWGTALALLMVGMAWLLSNTRLEDQPPIEDAPALTLSLEAPPGKQFTFPGNGAPANQVAFSPDGTLLAAAYDDGYVSLYKTTDQQLALTFDADPQGVSSLTFTSSGRLLTLGKNNATLSIWKSDGTHLQTLTDISGNPQRVGISAAGTIQFLRHPNEFIATAQSPWLTPRGQKITPIILPPLAGEVVDATLSPDGNILATGSKSGSIYFWQITVENGQRVGTPLRVLKGHDGPITALAFHPSGTWLVSASSDGTIYVWTVENGNQLYTLLDTASAPLSLAFAPDGASLAASLQNGTVYLWRAGQE